jgi:hypothetical protein
MQGHLSSLPYLAAFFTATLAAPANNAVPHPMITPAPTITERELSRRAVDPISWINSVVSGFGSSASSYVVSGVPQYFQDFPTGSKVESSLGINDDDLAAKPTQVLNLPWVTIHATLYSGPELTACFQGIRQLD